jgi:peptidyl-prolyl cis-trans isomerase A (cyclophilin A)
MIRFLTPAILSLFAVSAIAQEPAAAPKPAREPGLYATIHTSMGPITLRLFEKEAPITVRNFVMLATGRKAWTDPKTRTRVTRPLYNGTTFHRVIKGFMIQGGDPAGDGTGEVGFSIKDEFVPTLKFDKPGLLAMANTGEPNTGACQFFITVAPYPYGNGKHTIFGQVVDGYPLVEKISQVKTIRPGDLDKPATPIRILNISFEREGPAPANDPLAPARRVPAKK